MEENGLHFQSVHYSIYLFFFKELDAFQQGDCCFIKRQIFKCFGLTKGTA